MKPLLNIKQASELTGLSVPTLYKYIFLRTVPHVKISTRVLFNEDQLSAWVAEHQRVPVASEESKGGRRSPAASLPARASPRS